MDSQTDTAIKEFVCLVKVSVALSKRLASVKVNQRSELSLACLSQMTIHSVSTLKLLPSNESNLDLTLISAAGRSVLELGNNCFFYGAEQISKEEAHFRHLVFDYISIKSRKRTAESLNASKSEMADWELTDKELSAKRVEICNHELFNQLIISNEFQGFDSLTSSDNNKNKYNSRESLLKRRGLNIALLKPIYSIKSTLIHNSPSAISQHIHYLRVSSQNQNADVELEIAVSLASILFCLFAITMAEIISTHCSSFYEEINEYDRKILSDYSGNYKIV